MTVIFFFYGLAFFILGLSIFLYPKKESAFKLAEDLWLIAMFGMLHGINEWIDMFMLIQTPEVVMFLKTVRMFLIPLSFVFLVEFGVKVIYKSKRGYAGMKFLPLVLSLSWFIILVMSAQRFLMADIWARYLLGAPGAILTAFALSLQLPELRKIGLPQLRRNLKLVVSTFFCYGLCAGLVVSKAGFFPASVINSTLFIEKVGIPIQIFRTLCAAVIAYGMIRVLGVFDWETKMRIKNLLDETQRSKNELEKAYQKLQETQDFLIQAEKLNAVGQLASGLAHEVRNPLAIIIQGINYLENKITQESEDIREVFSMIKENVGRADNIISALLDFSRMRQLELKPQNINLILEHALILIKHRVKLENIEILKELKADLPLVLIDSAKMEQVFVNVFLNAIQAMPKGGKISICSYTSQLNEPRNGIGRRETDSFRLGEKVVVIEIEDTGMGISKENLKKVFDPFFTTKPPGQGTGLGLSVSKNIITMHKGLIEISSQEGIGTQVSLTLKICEAL